MKIICRESKSVNQHSVYEWLAIEWPLIIQDYDNKDIFNAETRLLFKMVSSKTLSMKREACHGAKISKKRLTVCLCPSMLGKKGIIIGKYLRTRCFKNENLECIHYHANKNAWMKSDIFKHELLKWDSELRRNSRKILLINDNCSAHPNINDLLTNIKLVFLPPNTTSFSVLADSNT